MKNDCKRERRSTIIFDSQKVAFVGCLINLRRDEQIASSHVRKSNDEPTTEHIQPTRREIDREKNRWKSYSPQAETETQRLSICAKTISNVISYSHCRINYVDCNTFFHFRRNVSRLSVFALSHIRFRVYRRNCYRQNAFKPEKKKTNQHTDSNRSEYKRNI